MSIHPTLKIELDQGQKVYFASDFHLGVPSYESSRERENKLVRWLDQVSGDAHSIFLMGDIFDFWFEYKQTIPKGYVRFQGKLAELSDKGINIYFFTGNHDMWMFDYFPKEFNIPVFRDPIDIEINNKKLLIGHGDGLGPGDHTYKFLRKFFRNPVCQWLFARLHPNFGIGLANFWSKKSRISSGENDSFHGENEWLLIYAKEQEAVAHRDYYVFGHRHLPMELKVGDSAKYINLGEWVNHFTFATFDSGQLKLSAFEK